MTGSSGVTLAINANFFRSDGTLEGYCSDGQEAVKSIDAKWTSLVFDGDRAYLSVLPEDGSLSAISGGPVLVKNGGYVANEVDNSFLLTAEARTLVGLTDDSSQIICMVIEGPSPVVFRLGSFFWGWERSDSAGATGRQAADLMLDEGATQVLNLDGGGSSQMIIRDGNRLRTANVFQEGSERDIGSGLAFCER